MLIWPAITTNYRKWRKIELNITSFKTHKHCNFRAAATSNARIENPIRSNQIEYFRVKSRCAVDLCMHTYLVMLTVMLTFPFSEANFVRSAVIQHQAAKREKNPECARAPCVQYMQSWSCSYRCACHSYGSHILDTLPISKRSNMFRVFFRVLLVYSFIHSFLFSISKPISSLLFLPFLGMATL